MAADDGACDFLFDYAPARLAVDGVAVGVVRGVRVCAQNPLNGCVPRGFLYRRVWGAGGGIFSADEITFMRTACAGRLKRLQDELAAYYKKNPEQTSGQLVLPEAEYDRDKFDFYAHWPVEIQGKPEQGR